MVSPDQNMAQVPLEQAKNETIENKELVTNGDQKAENTVLESESENPNWRAFREARKRERAEKEAAERRAAEKEAEVEALKAAMEAAFSKTMPQQQQYGYPEDETEDERIQKKIDAALAVREQQYQAQQQEIERQQYPQRLKQTYSDFNQVIAQENLDYLDYHYPEVSGALQMLPDGYDKWAKIYQNVKRFVPNHSDAKRAASKAEANQAKPKSMSSIGAANNPGEAQGATIYDRQAIQADRAARWERMQRTLKGLS